MSEDRRNKMNRREALLRLGAGSAMLIPASFLLGGCGSAELSCKGDADAAQRTMFKYVDKSTTANQTCDNCAQWKAGAPNQCGGCNLIKGQIQPKGWCMSWAAKPA